MRIYIETYGCAANQAESEIIAGLLAKAGFDVVKNIVVADIVIVNSCVVKHTTEQRLLSRLKEISVLQKKLIIAGCAPEGLYKKITDAAPEASLVSTHQITKIAQVVKKVLAGKRVELLGETKEVKLCLPRIRTNPLIAIVEIAEGCVGNCSYCATRFAKGKLFSYPKGKILKEVSIAVKGGCRELWLTAQDTAVYGLDCGETLPLLLKEITKIPGNFFVRVGMANPKNVLPILNGLIDAYNSEKIYKFLHLPVQSGSDAVLEKMKRGYKIEEAEKIISCFRKAYPRLQLWTDVIVGFSGESDSQFENTLKFLESVKPDFVNVSRYGIRDGTEAAGMPQIKTEIKKQRSVEASALARKLSLEKNKGLLGWSGRALITEKTKTGFMGRNFAYKPIVINSDKNVLGKIVDVKIVGATQTALLGEVIS